MRPHTSSVGEGLRKVGTTPSWLRAPIGSASRMSKNFRVFNVTRRYSMKFNSAEKAVEKTFSMAWVDASKTEVRDLSLAESLEAEKGYRLRQSVNDARLTALADETLPYYEVEGRKFDPPESGIVAMRLGSKLIAQAHKFFDETKAAKLAALSVTN